MKKTIRSFFIVFAILTVLLSGCAPATTSIPPTLISQSTNTLTPTVITPTAIPPTNTPLPTPTEVPWILSKSIVTEEKPIEIKNTAEKDWQQIKIAGKMNFSGAFEIKLNMESKGSNGIILTQTLNKGGPWWKDNKRMDIMCYERTLGIVLRDGSSEQQVYDNAEFRPLMPYINGATICQITIRFDQYGKNIQIFHDNEVIAQIIPEKYGNFPGGLFPDGTIQQIELASGPRSINIISSGSDISNGKLIELGFYVPPE
jgi:hypothetical protein